MGDPLITREQPLAGKTIMVNPGHGCMTWIQKGKKKVYEFDTGAKTKLNEKTIYEMNLNDQVAEKLATKLKDMGAKVIYVDNTPVTKTKKMENEIKPDLFIAIHHDAKGTKGKNTGETIYANSDISIKAAKFINERLKEDKTIPNNKINSNAGEAQRLTVLRVNKSIPAVLTEIGYITNPKELNELMSDKYQNTAAEKITEGIRDYFAGKRVETPEESMMHMIKAPFEFKPTLKLKK